jgi:hypothetical protein
MNRYLSFGFVLLILIASSVASGNDSEKAPLVGPKPTADQWHFMVDVELNSPIIGAISGGDRILNTRAMQARIGAGRDRLGIFGFVERAHFEEPSYADDVSNDLFSLGAGASWSYFEHRMRSMILLGTTILLSDSFQNDRGTMGLYTEIRPAGFVLKFQEFNLQIYPVSLSWLIPVLQNIPLFYVHFRTAISVGGTF